jgi:hypothetical protein
MSKKKPEFISNGGTLPGMPPGVAETIVELNAEADKATDQECYDWAMERRKKAGHSLISFEEFMHGPSK